MLYGTRRRRGSCGCRPGVMCFQRTTTTEEQALCSDLATKQRNVEKARDHENLARLHRDRRDLACSSTANSFEESDDFGWKQSDKFNRTEYESVWKSTGASGARVVRNRHRHAIERTRRNILMSTQVQV